MRIKAQITIYAALSFVLVITLVCTCIKSAIRTQADVSINMASRLSVESVFSEYSKAVLDEFDIFVIKDDGLDAKLKKYAVGNFEEMASVEYVYSEFSDKNYITDNNGVNVERQVVEYMKAGALSELLADEDALKKEKAKSDKVKEISDDIVACEEELFKADIKLLEVVSLVEGIKTNESGLVIRSGKAVATGQYFAKALISKDLSRDVAAVDCSQVYSAVSAPGNKYRNVSSLLDDMAEDIEVLLEYETDGDEDGVNNCKKIYENNYKVLTEAVSETYEKTRDALKKVNDYYTLENISNASFKKCMEKTESSKELLGEELTKSLMEDLEVMTDLEKEQHNKLCDIAVIEKGLKSNKLVLERIIKKAKELELESDTDYSQLIKGIKSCKEICKELSNKSLKFNYATIDFSKDAKGTDAIDTIKETLENGICGLVLPEGVSDKSVNYTDLANSLYDKENKYSVAYEGEHIRNLAESVMFDGYIVSRIPNYMDAKNLDKEKEIADWCELKYPFEYVLCGNSSDKDNINEIILELSAIREGINLAHLLTDTTKKNEAMAMATTMVGFTGNIAVVKVVQYLILAIWAYGESICDLRNLFKGDRIPIIKTKKDWNLSLSNLMKMNFETGTTGQNNPKEGILDGTMSYEDYLKLLLAICGEDEKRMNLLSVMELHMIMLGKSDFRMKNYIVSATGTVTLKRTDNNTFFCRDIKFCY